MTDILRSAEQLADTILKEVNVSLDASGDSKHMLGVVNQSLTAWKQLSRDHGFEIVGIDVYLPEQLAEAQRKLLKDAFARQGFKFENIGQERLVNDHNMEMTQGLDSHKSDPQESGGSAYKSHPEIDVRGMPLQRFYIDADILQEQAESRTTNKANNKEANKNELKLSLKFSPKMEGPKLKDRAVYKPGDKPPAPTPRMDITLRPLHN